jgi:primosomal protein N' (replication factor Y)
VLDRRRDDPTRAGPFADRLAERVRGDGRVVCVLNRKGRSRLLACSKCGELVRSDDGTVPMVMVDDRLSTPDGTESRPVVCAHCGATTLKNLRAGVTRAAEELAALVGEPVDEVTADGDDPPSTRVVIGTEAVLHRVHAADVVVFLDLDQELLAPRQRATEQAFALLARAARLLGPRREAGRLVLQTRQPEHEVVQAALHADPSIVAVAERDRRKDAGIAPYGAQALVSGAAAGEFMAAFGRPEGVRIRGPLDGRWLLRAETHAPMLDALAATPRPGGRVRIEVDPLRV